MAQRVNVIVLCDLDEEPEAIPTTITVDGDTVEIDLCADHRLQLESALQEFYDAGRRTGRRRKATVVRANGRATSSEPADKEERTRIRSWAQGQGYEVGNRGRISAEIVAAYTAAH